MNININTNLTTLMDLLEKQGMDKAAAWDAMKAIIEVSKETPAKAPVHQTPKTTYSYAGSPTHRKFWTKFYPSLESAGFTKRGTGSLNKWTHDYMCLDYPKNGSDRSFEAITVHDNEVRVIFKNHISLTPAQKASIESAVGQPIQWKTRSNGRDLKAYVVLPGSCWKNVAEHQKLLDTAVKLRDALAPYACA